MTAQEIIKELPKGLIKWYEFKKGTRALYITGYGNLDQSLEEALLECGLYVECAAMDEVDGRIADELGRTVDGGYDRTAAGYEYILMSSVVEQAESEAGLIRLLKMVRTLLKADGKLFLVTENRMAVRYFCGDKDPFTGRNFDGIENYKRVSAFDKKHLAGRLYSKAELTGILEQAGFPYHRFYSVFPDITSPQILFAEDYTPDEELDIRIFPQYHSPDTVFLEEENLYTSMIQNGLFHKMANGFLIECSLEAICSNASQITVSTERGKENALCTIIVRDGMVIKKPLYAEGRRKLGKLWENNCYLQRHGVRMIEGSLVDGTFVMPFVDGMSMVKHFRQLMAENKNEFLRQFDCLWNLILHSSEHVAYDAVDWDHFNPRWDEEKNELKQKKIDRSRWKKVAFGSDEDREALGAVLERGYIDLVLLNGFVVNGEYVFFDQELYVENLPAKAIMLRNIDLLYHGDTRMEVILPRKELLERYKLDSCIEIYYAHIGHFLNKLRNDDILYSYHLAHRRNHEIVHSNRQRMNYSAQEYQRLFVDIFKNLDNKKLYLFGAGNFARKFLALYRDEYEIAGVIDNNETKWGTAIEGIEIAAPSVLEGLDAGTYKVIICIKNYVGAFRQVRDLGAINIGIYDPNTEYPRRQGKVFNGPLSGTQVKKKYHIGYAAGVFDLFHVGHLNLLRRAKEQCDYLIVGVVTDEGVRRNKQTDSVIPFEERLAMVQACRYVDEAVEIPFEFCDTKDAYLKYQFDAQFSGSDYARDPAWLKKREFLREHGAELVFLSYTESTSSTKIKEMINRKLL